MEKIESNELEIVVSDTTPLISLMKLGHLELIKKLFGKIIIPQAVYNELVCDVRFQSEGQQIKNASYISVVKYENEHSLNLLRRSSGLDLGESEAILLADDLNASFILMDEAKGRQVANQMGLELLGTIGILMIAYKEHLLNKQDIYDCIYVLKSAERRISDKLYQQLIDYISKE